VAWVKREMILPGGFFASAQDADSLDPESGHMEEGFFATWTVDEVREVLGSETEQFCAQFGICKEGNFLEESTRRLTGRNILHLSEPSLPHPCLADLLAVRQQRHQPVRDDKALLSSNSLMISGLAVFGELSAATSCAEAWLSLWTEGGLPHQVVDGRPEGTAFLDDLAFFSEALLDLSEATAEDKWQKEAIKVLDWVDRQHADPRGGCWFTPHGAETLYSRTKPWLDKAEPSANGALLRARIRLGQWEESLPHIAVGLPWARRMPQATETILEALLLWIEGQGSDSLEPALSMTHLESTQIRMTLMPKAVKADPEGWAAFLLTISLPDGVHINSQEPATAWLHPTQLRLVGALGEAGFPEAEEDRYQGDVVFPIRVKAPKETVEFQLAVSFQACTDTECLPPEERVLTARVLVEG